MFFPFASVRAMGSSTVAAIAATWIAAAVSTISLHGTYARREKPGFAITYDGLVGVGLHVRQCLKVLCIDVFYVKLVDVV